VTLFGDADPEDAWDDGDLFEEKIAILEQVAVVLRATRDDPRHDRRRADALRLVVKLIVTGREPLRLAELRDALEAS
jgi:hypothetical protein